MKTKILTVAILFLFFFCIFPKLGAAQFVASTNVLQRTFQIKFGTRTGTCFTIDLEGRQYLITARHVVSEIRDKDQVEILRNGQWQSIPVKVFFPSPMTVDIAVLAPSTQVSPTHPLPPASEYFLSQDVYFLGFPFGLSQDGKKLNAGFPLPFVKKGIISAFVDSEDGAQLIVIDGVNNPGFSGGPVVVSDSKSGQLAIVGVVSGYRFQEDKIFNGNNETSLSVRNNSGLLLAYGIKHIIDVIKANPVGASIK